ncbi:kinase-like domain-containing protein [Ochromonadaceae sp. CCMP2298]|nr:kinase-like domain-containing protein [Ochromonadaceae sp. CCMP2298]
MTGYTGSLRYMAPEVALREPYTEKVDVYSYGIMLWQMARDRLPFTGLGKTGFMQEVVRGGIRPKLDKNWPPGFTNLLTSCWQRDPENRPSFSMLIIDLNKLVGEVMDKGTASKRGRPIRGMTKSGDAHSSWF